jgi:hypothetical protein
MCRPSFLSKLSSELDKSPRVNVNFRAQFLKQRYV